MIKAAIVAKIRPTSMIFHVQPNDPWIDFDFKLLLAYQGLMDETCPHCQNVIWLCRTSDPRVQFRVRNSTCHGERRLLEYEDAKKAPGSRADKAEKKDWGVHYYVEPFVPENVEGDLPTRAEYYETLLEKVNG